MKKVTNITLGGVIFVIEDDAYDALSAYIKSFEIKFLGSPDYSEIAADIESAIAEKFRMKAKSDKKAVTLPDVEEAVKEVGTAEEVVGESGPVGGSTASGEEPRETVKKRLYRDPDNHIIAGVASGIAHYFGIDPVIVRILFVIAAFFNGIGILAYIILWLLVPAAKTTAQKYAMRGEGMTIADITKRVKKNIHDIGPKDIERAKGVWGAIRGFLEQLFELFGNLMRGILVLLRYVVGILCIFFGVLGIAGLTSFTSVMLFSDNSWAEPELVRLMEHIFANDWGGILTVCMLVVLLIPHIALIMVGGSLFAKRNLFTVTKTLILFISWIVALTLAGTIVLLNGPAFLEWHELDQDFDHWPPNGGEYSLYIIS